MTFKLTDDQNKAMLEFTDFLKVPEEKYMVVQGAAGTGKSTMIAKFKEVANAYYDMRALLVKKDEDPDALTLYLTATTNPAVAVLENLTGQGASTTHSFLQLTPRKNFKTGKLTFVPKKDAEIHKKELIIIDEGSMIDIALAEHLDQLTENCKIIVIGDQYQLASVGQLVTVMEQMNCRKVYMNQIMRNSGIILETGAQFRASVETSIFKAIPKGHAELCWVDGEDFQSLMDEAFTDPNYHPLKAKVVAWTNRMVLGYSEHIRESKNLPPNFMVGESAHTNQTIIQKGFHRSTDSIVDITGMGAEYTESKFGITGRKVELFNKITLFLPSNQQEVKNLLKNLARRKEWEDHYYIKDNWLDLRHPYACTVHKAQGSSYDTVFINLADIGKCNVPSEVARMLYVSISRARKKVVLFGELPPWYDGTITEPITPKLIGEKRMLWEAGML